MGLLLHDGYVKSVRSAKSVEADTGQVLLPSGGAALEPYAQTMLPPLLQFAERDEEGVRNVVAECLGKLAAVAPDAVVPALQVRLSHASALTRAAVVNSLRFTLTEFASGAPIPEIGRAHV